jgi:hypothetical protein
MQKTPALPITAAIGKRLGNGGTPLLTAIFLDERKLAKTSKDPRKIIP